jgi:molybdopterin-guanine dinucleotide biosynthesis protein MobB
MKIIQVVGRSNSGKTTFIRNLIPELKKKGKVGVIKHLGDHEFGLEAGKDTTFFFEAGADITSGIDAQKTVMAIHNNTLDETLRAYLTYGIDFTVIEGYKEQEYAKIVIGALEVDRCILKNPTIVEVIQSIDCFDNFLQKK